MIMNEIDDKKIMAFADGCLDETEAAEVREMIANDPVLLAEVARLQQTRRSVNEAVDELANAPIPEAVLDMLRKPTRSSSPQEKNIKSQWLNPLAIAASLGIAFYTGTLLQETNSAGNYLPVEAIQALNTAADDTKSNGYEVQASYLDNDGNLCRTFTPTAADGSGLACRSKNSEWQLVAFVSSPTLGYTPASGDPTALLSAYTDQMTELEDGLEQEYLIRQ